MSRDVVAIDGVLAAALRGERNDDSDLLHAADVAAVLDRITYHGVAGLLREASGAMVGWPEAIVTGVRTSARVLAMWELRHRQLLNHLVGTLAGANIDAVFLKGTALAYDLYAAPASRARGDSDLLVAPGDLARARDILVHLGFERVGDDGDVFSRQEAWSHGGEGAQSHHIDLHWHPLNTPALDDVLPVAEALASWTSLPRLGPDARRMDRVRTLIHTCIHRTLNFTSPYIVDDRTYFGGDRLIWLNDIHLLADALTEVEWHAFSRLAVDKGVAASCLDGLEAAQRWLAMPVPEPVRDMLAAATASSRPATYLRARQFGRAWRDLVAIPGAQGKLSYLATRLIPSTQFIRDKYPRHAALPLPLLYGRRVVELVRPRPTHGVKQ